MNEYVSVTVWKHSEPIDWADMQAMLTENMNDQCGVCKGGATAEGVAWCGETADDNCCDCLGVPNGSAYLDVCENCVGGNTGNPDAFDIGIGASYLKIASRSENNRIPVNASNVGSLNSFYMELDYDSTDIQIKETIDVDGDINNNYNKLVHYDTISNNTSFNKRVIFNLIYSPEIDCSDYNDEVCEENNGDCFWNDNTGECEQNQFSNGCDSTDVIFQIKLNASVVEGVGCHFPLVFLILDLVYSIEILFGVMHQE